MYDHHWKDGATLKPDPTQYFGFLYEIRELDTNKLYIGIKQYWFSAGVAKRRCMDRQSSKWNSNHWKPSDWRTYTGSSKVLNKQIKAKGLDNYEFSIIGQYPCSRSLRYAEANYLHKLNVLAAKDDDGEYIYYNQAIGAIKFRPPEVFSEESKEKMAANHDYEEIARKIRAGSPVTCTKCGDNNWRPITVRGHKTRGCQTCKAESQRKRRAKQKDGP